MEAGSTNAAEVRTSAGSMVATVASALALGVFAVGMAIWNHLSDEIAAEWLTDLLAVIFLGLAVYLITAQARGRWRLLPDRIESRGAFQTTQMFRHEVSGYRIEPTRTIRLVSTEDRRRDMLVPLQVANNPAWAAWLDSLTSFDVAEHNAAIKVLQEDLRLGPDPASRLARLDLFRRWARRARWIGIALCLWLWIYPEPYGLAVALNVAAPLVALALASLWPGLVALDQTDAEPTIDIGYFWLPPSLIVAFRAYFDIQAIDWPQALLAGAVLAILPGLCALRAAKASRRPWQDRIAAVILLGWGYGAVSLANVIFDDAAPTIHQAEVVKRDAKSDYPSLSLRVIDPAADLPPLDELRVSRTRALASSVGARACVAIHPGRFGWRYAYVVDCPSAKSA